MMKHEVLITLIGNMFIDAYVAGDRKDLESFRTARADRDQLYDEVNDLYAELEHESYEREQFQLELKEANEKIKAQKELMNRLNEEIGRRIDEKRAIFNGNPPTLGMKLRLSEIYGKAVTDDPDIDDIPDDAGKFSEQDLPFPDVEDIAPAEEVEGSWEGGGNY